MTNADDKDNVNSTLTLFPCRDACVYTPAYCEENVWCLCDHVRKSATIEDLHKSFAVFISNKNKTVPIWEQKLGTSNVPVVWDYHVIFIYKCDDGTAWVFDLDTKMTFPCLFTHYANSAIKSDRNLNLQYHRCFRVVPAKVFLEKFASDRSHMMKSDGQFKSPPPEYPAIASSDSTNNLDDFISMVKATGWGDVTDCQSFIQQFSKATSIAMHHTQEH